MEIEALRGTYPHPFYAEQFVFTGANLKGLLESDEGIDYLQLLVKKGCYRQGKEPIFYVYRVEAGGETQTGIWALASMADYRGGRIKKHERVIPEKIKRPKPVEGKPVLLAYAPDKKINQLIAVALREKALAIYHLGNSTHKLYAAPVALKTAFASLSEVYVADGHHRLEGSSGAHISALWMASDQLNVLPYHRILSAGEKLSLNELKPLFFIRESFNGNAVFPSDAGRFGLRLDGKWYELVIKAPQYDFDAAFLTREVFGKHPVTYSHDISKVDPSATLFTLSPLSLSEIMQVADAGQTLPPKSTWMEPKVPFGLLIHQN